MWWVWQNTSGLAHAPEGERLTGGYLRKAEIAEQRSLNNLNKLRQVARGAAIGAIVAFFLGFCSSFFAMKCINVLEDDPSSKKRIGLIAAAFWILAGVFIGAAVSYYSYNVSAAEWRCHFRAWEVLLNSWSAKAFIFRKFYFALTNTRGEIRRTLFSVKNKSMNETEHKLSTSTKWRSCFKSP